MTINTALTTVTKTSKQLDAEIEAAVKIRAISGEFDRAALNKLLWPIAWSGTASSETRQAYEDALRELVAEAREALAQDRDAVAVEIKDGAVVATVHAE